VTGRGDGITLEALERDPDPVLADLRANEPVAWVPALDMWLVTRWDDVAHVDAHPEVFSAATEPSFLARALGRNMLTVDPPAHTRLKDALGPPFGSGSTAGRFAADDLTGQADDLIDAFADRGEADVMSGYADALAAASLAAVLGLGDHGWAQVWAWCGGLCADIANFENDPALTAQGDEAREALGVAIGARLDELRAAAADTALGHYLGTDLTDDEIVNNVRLMISGGINEPRDGIGLVAWTLLTHPDALAEVRADPKLWRRAVEETFRLHSPVGTITRQATEDVTLAGADIRAGQLVSGVLRSANRDEDHWSDPDRFDLHRREGGHAAFALGAHRCLGEWLGRQEVRVGAQRLFDRLPNLRLDPDQEVTMTGFEFRGPAALHLRWDR
jgi:cytochrome P450